MSVTKPAPVAVEGTPLDRRELRAPDRRIALGLDAHRPLPGLGGDRYRPRRHHRPPGARRPGAPPPSRPRRPAPRRSPRCPSTAPAPPWRRSRRPSGGASGTATRRGETQRSRPSIPSALCPARAPKATAAPPRASSGTDSISLPTESSLWAPSATSTGPAPPARRYSTRPGQRTAASPAAAWAAVGHSRPPAARRAASAVAAFSAWWGPTRGRRTSISPPPVRSRSS